ncbi:MAG: hypothetical protein HQL56_10115 [Magnetococcales bacterium]|nr:hypothetical protein [Magnetococcales bacterium]
MPFRFSHVTPLLRLVLFVILLGGVAGHLGYWALRSLVVHSPFRVLVAYHAQEWIPPGSRITLFLGDSRIMGGISSPTINGLAGRFAAFNLAFNGLDFYSATYLAEQFRRSCGCRVERLVINIESLPYGEGAALKGLGIPDLTQFLAAFDPELQGQLARSRPVFARILRVFPLLFFNNEYFWRSLYYWLSHRDDQSYANNYRLHLSEGMLRRSASTLREVVLNRVVLEHYLDSLKKEGIELIILRPPYHPAFERFTGGIEAYYRQPLAAIDALRITTLDHASHFESREELFSDAFHLNADGQKEYSRFIHDLLF